jgi:hypothetical protein
MFSSPGLLQKQFIQILILCEVLEKQTNLKCQAWPEKRINSYFELDFVLCNKIWRLQINIMIVYIYEVWKGGKVSWLTVWLKTNNSQKQFNLIVFWSFRYGFYGENWTC